MKISKEAVVTSSLRSPRFSTDEPERAVSTVARQQFWASIIVSVALFVVAIFLGGQAGNFEDAAAAPHHWVAAN
jgi:hypothetical protein